jgi:hypothetical protein
VADPSNYLIAGAMPFGTGGNPYSGAGVGNLGAAYQQSYQSALDQNKALYQDILGGYQQTMQNQVGAQNQVQGGYGQLTSQVLGGIQGIGASQAQAIQDVYAQQSGQAQQGLTSRGLGNTTVSDSVQRGLTLDKGKAQIALANQIAQTNAGYQSQLGLAGLNYGNQAAMQNTGQANQQLGFMNTVQAQYPNASAYNQLAQMSGQFSQANADRSLLQQQAMRGRATAGTGGGTMVGNQGGPMGTPMGLPSHGVVPQTDFANYGNAGGSPYAGGISATGEMPAMSQFDQTSPYQAPQGPEAAYAAAQGQAAIPSYGAEDTDYSGYE